MPAMLSLRRAAGSRRLCAAAAPVAAAVLLVLGFQSVAAVVGPRSSALYAPLKGCSQIRIPGQGAVRSDVPAKSALHLNSPSSARAAAPLRVSALYSPAQGVLSDLNSRVRRSSEECTSLELPRGRSGRRTAASAGLFAALGPFMPPAVAAAPVITARCAFDVRFGKEKVNHLRQLVIGLYGKEAPVMTKTFIQASTSTYPGEAGNQASYKLSDVKSVVKDKLISWADFKDGNMLEEIVTTFDSRWVGKKSIMKPLAGDDTKTDEDNGLRHNLAGRVSMRRGGGTFDFNIAPVADAKWLDETDVVIGQVLEGMDI
eukprot:CAMPEP_0171145036 /NCGR_PEP_ID=MMETSP0766_2-20121228/146855_2 /TAXON_ID=439317 /ORGANISM="Gambierdiscus australes, Strain CAWD 149" /LENGTH=314 /DNA_ID=CAMNT_0011608925 /DNA_START=42 /DNA_END=984 /DNA_ORIENTATION=-